MKEKPVWYVTPQEFADLVVETMEEIGYFKADEFNHPEDILVSFESVSHAIAAGMGYAGRRVWAAEDAAKKKMKQAMMQANDLKKVVLPDDQELRPTGYM